MNVQQAITAVMEDVRAVGKNDRNTQQNFNFRGIDAVVNALSPVMKKHGVSIRPSGVLSTEYLPFTSKSGSLGVSCRLVVEYTFSGPDGDEVKAVVASEANDHGDKSTPKAMSVAYRTCLLQAFALPTTDTDPDAETYDRAPAQEPRGPAPSPDWNALFLAAKGNKSKLEALRNQGRKAGLADDFGMFTAIQAELEVLTATAPVEGKLV